MPRRLNTQDGGSVADFHIRGRVEAKACGSYAAIVVAIPLLDTEPFRKMQEICPSRGAAVQRLRELAVMMGAKIRQEGGTILEVRIDE